MIEVSIADIFTEEELDKAGELYAETDPDDFVKRCADEIVMPALPRIDQDTGESNDPLALAEQVRRTMSAIMGTGGFVAGLQ